MSDLRNQIEGLSAAEKVELLDAVWESLEADEIKALDEAREWLKHNAGIPHDQVLAELGITQEEIDRCNKAR